MAKKKPGDTTISERKGSIEKDAPDNRVSATGGTADAAKTVQPPTPRKRLPRRKSKAVSRRPSPDTAKTGAAGESGLAAILGELRGVREMVQQIAAPPTAADAALEESVDSLRRLLSDLIERRMESVVRDLVDVRRVAASSNGDRGRIVDRLDELLDSLGAVRFEPEPMDIVDPLIHVVVNERRDDKVPDGVILDIVQPGYRTARGLVLCKSAVAVNRRT